MKTGSFFILSIIILLFGAISTVSAENKVYSNEIVLLNNISNIQDNSTIIINSGEVTYSGVQTISANNIVIKAEGTVIFKAKTNYNNYFLIKGDNVTIQGITFANSFGNSAVVWDGVNGQIKNCTFADNKAVNGAAVTWNGANGQIKDTIFSNNLATKNGAAISWNGTNGQINNCLFCNNEAKDSGVISWTPTNGAIINSQFINCTAKTGSALYIKLKEDEENDHTTLTDNQFVNCKSSGNNKANILSNAPNLYLTGGSGALISLEGAFASINSPVTVTILNNETFSVLESQELDLIATIKADGDNNTILNAPFSFTINNEKNSDSGKVKLLSEENTIKSNIPAIMNNDIYTASYIKDTTGLTIVSGDCENCNNVSYKTAAIDVKEDPNMTIETNNFTYGEDLNITVKTNTQTTGNVTLIIMRYEVLTEKQSSNEGNRLVQYSKTLWNQTITKEIANGIVQFHNIKLAAGNYSIIVFYCGDEKYYATTVLGGFNVDKAHPIIKIQTKTIKEGENEPVTITVTDKNGTPLTGNVTVNVDDNLYGIFNLTNGTAHLEIANLTEGDHNLTATYNGNENFTREINSTNIHVNGLNWWEKNWKIVVGVIVGVVVVVVVVTAIVYLRGAAIVSDLEDVPIIISDHKLYGVTVYRYANDFDGFYAMRYFNNPKILGTFLTLAYGYD